MNFSKRIYDKELLDRDDIPFSDILQNMKELNTINHLLGGHKITIRGLQTILEKTKYRFPELHIAEIGSGGGDNLRILQKYCHKHSIKARFTGIDINPHCIASAKLKQLGSEIQYIHSDYKEIVFDQRPDIIFSSLFCHHFVESELVNMFGWMYANSTLGFFINDLQRHPFAYYSIMVLTKLYSKSYLVKNDAPLSVRRGFNKNELVQLLEDAGIRNYDVSWKWAFRFLVIALHDAKTSS
ncbi:MAG TPA: methyltransferase domain-containing protein [Flavitalea sp.]|nr:methyltransferase domain-containing protein [Flavitalea sp.]